MSADKNTGQPLGFEPPQGPIPDPRRPIGPEYVPTPDGASDTTGMQQHGDSGLSRAYRHALSAAYALLAPPIGATDDTPLTETAKKPDERTAYDQARKDLSDLERDTLESMERVTTEMQEFLDSDHPALTMSKEEFQLYFGSDEFPIDSRLNQRNFPDCTLVATLHGLTLSPTLLEFFARTSMRKNGDGSWHVRLPFTSTDEEGAEIISVQPGDIAPKRPPKKWREEHATKQGLAPRTRLWPLRGTEGLQVLEAAYHLITHGQPLGYKVPSDGITPPEALQMLAGPNILLHNTPLDLYESGSTTDDYDAVMTETAIMDHYLGHYDPTYMFGILVLGAKHTHPTDPDLSWDGFHAYSIVASNPRRGTFTLANPWETSASLDLELSEIRQLPHTLTVARPDFNRISEILEATRNGDARYTLPTVREPSIA